MTLKITTKNTIALLGAGISLFNGIVILYDPKFWEYGLIFLFVSVYFFKKAFEFEGGEK